MDWMKYRAEFRITFLNYFRSYKTPKNNSTKRNWNVVQILLAHEQAFP